jgi:hypothetical protein
LNILWPLGPFPTQASRVFLLHPLPCLATMRLFVLLSYFSSSTLCLPIYSSAFRWVFFLRGFLPEFVLGLFCVRFSKTPLIRTLVIRVLVIRIAKYPDWLGPSGIFIENSTKLTYFVITGYRIKNRTALWLVQFQIRRGRKVWTQVHKVNSNSRNSNCQCNLFSKKNSIIQTFWISGCLAVSIKLDKCSYTVFTTCPAQCSLIRVYVNRAMFLYNPCSSSRYLLPRCF